MKKFLGTTLAVAAVCGFMIAGTGYACDEAKTEKTSGTASACSAKATTATTASAKTTTAKGAVCSPDNKAACGATATATDAKLVNSTTTMADCAKACTNTGTCQFRTVSVKGMTCGGCEQSVQTALLSTPGVLKVVSVSYKTGTAVICVDPTKMQEKTITTAIADKGFEAQVIPAVATTMVNTTTPTDAKACTAAGKAGCCADKKAAETKETTATTESPKKPL